MSPHGAGAARTVLKASRRFATWPSRRPALQRPRPSFLAGLCGLTASPSRQRPGPSTSAWRRPTYHSPRTTPSASYGSMPGTTATPRGTTSAPLRIRMAPSTTRPLSPTWTVGSVVATTTTAGLRAPRYYARCGASTGTRWMATAASCALASMPHRRRRLDRRLRRLRAGTSSQPAFARRNSTSATSLGTSAIARSPAASAIHKA